MIDGEDLVAERDVTIEEQQTLNVRISRHTEEKFWRVEVTSPARPGCTSATVADGESFLMNLIDDALRGSSGAWEHLALWGHGGQSRLAPGLRPAF
jgi:hypothetical protein